MIRSVNINWEALGAELMACDDNDQAKFFIGLAKELTHWKSDHLKQMQAFYVADKLPDDVKKELETFLGCFWYKDVPHG